LLLRDFPDFDISDAAAGATAAGAEGADSTGAGAEGADAMLRADAGGTAAFTELEAEELESEELAELEAEEFMAAGAAAFAAAAFAKSEALAEFSEELALLAEAFTAFAATSTGAELGALSKLPGLFSDSIYLPVTL
jgi:hypothetical protein